MTIEASNRISFVSFKVKHQKYQQMFIFWFLCIQLILPTQVCLSTADSICDNLVLWTKDLVQWVVWKRNIEIRWTLSMTYAIVLNQEETEISHKSADSMCNRILLVIVETCLRIKF